MHYALSVPSCRAGFRLLYDMKSLTGVRLGFNAFGTRRIFSSSIRSQEQQATMTTTRKLQDPGWTIGRKQPERTHPLIIHVRAIIKAPAFPMWLPETPDIPTLILRQQQSFVFWLHGGLRRLGIRQENGSSLRRASARHEWRSGDPVLVLVWQFRASRTGGVWSESDVGRRVLVVLGTILLLAISAGPDGWSTHDPTLPDGATGAAST